MGFHCTSTCHLWTIYCSCDHNRTEIIGWPLSDQNLAGLSKISQKQWKSCFCGRSLWASWSLIHLSYRVGKFGVHWNRSVKACWEIIGRSMRLSNTLEHLLSIRWAFVEHSLRGCFPWWSLRDCFGLSQNFTVIMVTVEIIGWSLTDLGDLYIAQWSQRSPPLCKGATAVTVVCLLHTTCHFCVYAELHSLMILRFCDHLR